jgi:hypothetical protein
MEKPTDAISKIKMLAVEVSILINREVFVKTQKITLL